MIFPSLTVILLVLTKRIVSEESNFRCTEEFCANYLAQKGCPSLSPECIAQNSTHSGIYLPYLDVCNCCDYCLINLAENEVCGIGAPGLPPPQEICGPGLYCTENKKGPATCQPRDPKLTKCTTAQADWDNRRADGTLGMTEVRPKCDGDGLFTPVHCIPGSICYCLSPNGERMFGEIPFLNPWDENKMTCECSLNHWKTLQTMDPQFLYETLTARCNDYGLFDPLQCMMGSNADCLCVDPITGEPKANTEVVKISKLKPGSPSCFDPTVHSVSIYESDCERMKLKWIEQMSSTTTIPSIQINGFERPECQPDGKYHRVQTLGTKRICVDPSGKQIENFEASVISGGGRDMDCNCARARWLLSNAGVKELPNCCSQGSFESWQCLRNDCFCVDDNGNQMGIEVDAKNVAHLACYNNNKPCPKA